MFVIHMFVPSNAIPVEPLPIGYAPIVAPVTPEIFMTVLEALSSTQTSMPSEPMTQPTPVGNVPNRLPAGVVDDEDSWLLDESAP